MRITNEADYALRIVYVLMNGELKNAKAISDESGVTLRFTLKILHKLTQAQIVSSVQGSAGGYSLRRNPKELSVADIVEIIDGPFCINNCLDDDFICSRVGMKTGCCKIHCFFEQLNAEIVEKMRSAKFDQFRPDTISDK